MGTNNYIAKLKLRLDQAIIQLDHWKQLAHKRDYIEVSETDPESRTESVWRVDAGTVRRMLAQIRHMEAALAEQGERQEAACWVPRACLDKLRNGRNNSPTVLTDGPAEFNDTPLYTAPQPGPDVRALVEALEECAASLAWNCFGECRAIHAGPIMPAAMALDTARAAWLITARRKAGSQNNDNHHDQE